MSKKIVAIGNAIVDIISKVDDSNLSKHGFVKGSMSLINQDQASELSRLEISKIDAGGSAANTIAALSQLNCKTQFVGKVGNDEFGKKFGESLKKIGVDFLCENYSPNQSAQSYILITPDAQRTMCTSLGCASEIASKDIENLTLDNSSILYIEGYLWDRAETISLLRQAIKQAKASGAKIAFSLSDSFCVSRHKNDFIELVKNDLDILFANENEIVELVSADGFANGFEAEKISKFLAQNPKLIAAITRSEKGCCVFSDGNFDEIATSKVDNFVDATGAGDAFAAGFIYTINQNLSLRQAADFGNKLAGKIIQKIGARFEEHELQNL